MTTTAIELGILLPAFAAGLLVTVTHVPLGIQVLSRGIVFIDLAIAQVAGLGVIFADWLGLEPQGWAVQAAAFAAAFVGALAAHLDRKAVAGSAGSRDRHRIRPGRERRVAAARRQSARGRAPERPSSRPDPVGELAAPAAGGADLRGDAGALVRNARAPGRVGFYLLFAAAVTVSVQLVGLYLVFTTLIVPALATHRVRRARLAICYALSACGYALGLLGSAVFDLPSGAVIVWAMAMLAVPVFAWSSTRLSAGKRAEG